MPPAVAAPPLLLLLLLGGTLRQGGAAARAEGQPRHGGAPPTPVLPPPSQPFAAGTDGYKLYRIPSLLHLANGDLLLFCEARGKGGEASVGVPATTDGGPTDIVTRRSSDGVRTVAFSFCMGLFLLNLPCTHREPGTDRESAPPSVG
eukprot:SAG31_NODE_3051_length_4742_cov_35.992031_2_plen_147_part_00